MDTQETGLYNILRITTVITSGILLYALITAVLQQVKYRAEHNREVGSEILARENERRWLAADMHDDLGPLLSAAKMAISAIHKENETDKVLLDQSMEHLDEITGKIRTLARGLMPAILLAKGLAMALQQFIKTVGTTTNMEIELTVLPLPHFTPDATIHLYRIVQEIIHNSIKHARARRLVINIYVHNNQLVLSAADDGIGFSNHKKKLQSGGYGLTGIKNRVHLLNGDFNLRSRSGTAYFIQIPQAGLTAGEEQE
ncbi:MAG: ATP-binding protein [Ferruginibacter sp.]